MKNYFWVVAAIIGGLWLISFTWHMFMRDWMPHQMVDTGMAIWLWVLDRIRRFRKGETV